MRQPILRYRLTDHCKAEMARRLISEEDIATVLGAPEHIDSVREGREVFQARLETGEPSKVYLFRVFVDVDRNPPQVVTVYRTSKIAIYWRPEQ